MSKREKTRVSLDKLCDAITAALRDGGMSEEHAATCGRIMAESTLDGVPSHGLHWVKAMRRHLERGEVVGDATPVKTASLGALEQWDGQLAPGPVAAMVATDRAMGLAKQHGIGCVALRNTNHWLRGGTYGWQAAEAGFALIAWTNAYSSMPPWGAKDKLLGNNPIVYALPRAGGHMVLDMALSQYSFGRLGIAKLNGDSLAVAGGFDDKGEPTRDPKAIDRVMPAGLWKGAGLSMMVDAIGAVLADGQTVPDLRKQGGNYSVVQVFIAFDVSREDMHHRARRIADQIVDDVHSAEPLEPGTSILYPGERALRTRKDGLANGIEVDRETWKQVKAWGGEPLSR